MSDTLTKQQKEYLRNEIWRMNSDLSHLKGIARYSFKNNVAISKGIHALNEAIREEERRIETIEATDA